MTMYLALKTDQAEVELYLLASDGEIAKQKIWLADREPFTSCSHGKDEQIERKNTDKNQKDTYRQRNERIV